MVQIRPKYKQKNTLFVSLTSTGKERDSETGFSYFGARYYDSDLMTSWLSVDPMADKYPSLSPYNYCAWNPIRLVDPDGEDVDDPPAKKKLKIANENNRNEISEISWGETSGLYPTKDVNNPKDIYNTEKWDQDKIDDLLKARAAIHLIGTKRNSHVNKIKCKMKGIEKMLATFHLVSNFPEVDPEILNDDDVKFFFLSSKKTEATPSINSKYFDQECVKTYGPFYNAGGGDVEKGPVYIHFYKAVEKKEKNNYE